MDGYRHLNLLIDAGLYRSLKIESQSRSCPVSTIVRDALKTFLGGTGKPKCEDVKSAGN